MENFENRIEALAARTVALYAQKGMTVATAESCTGGLVAKLITDIPGSSAVLKGGVVAYTNAVKISVLGVDAAVIARDTEVSHACACAMAEGARRLLQTQVAVSLTGYAGPGGGTARDPVGTVYIGVSTETGCICERFCTPANATRAQVREAAAYRALELLLGAAENS